MPYRRQWSTNVTRQPPEAVRGTTANDTHVKTRQTGFRDGDRFTITAEFVTRRTLNVNGDRVHRLLVEDEIGTRHALLMLPEAVEMVSQKTGAIYRFNGLVRSEPPRRDSDDGECPQCSYPLRHGRAVDAVSHSLAMAAFQLELDAPFGVVDEQTTIYRLRSEVDDRERVVDDWQPMENGSAQPDTQRPDYVCDACKSTFTADKVDEAVV